MKLTRIVLFLAALVLAGLIAFLAPTAQDVFGAYLLLFVACALLSRQTANAYATTLSVNELAQDILDAFKLELFSLGDFTLDMSSKTAVKGDVIIAKIPSLPILSAYDANNGGFKAGAQDSKSLLVDCPVSLDQFATCPIKIAYLDGIQSKINLYQKEIFNYGHVLAKGVLDFTLGKAVAANFSNNTTEAIANTNLTTLETIRTRCNAQRMATSGRKGILNSLAAGALIEDTRIASRDYYNQLNGDRGYRRFNNVAGFQTIWEYPDLPGAGNMSGIFFDPRAFVICNRLPNIQSMAKQLGVPEIMRFDTATDPDTGLTIMIASWQEAGTADVYSVAAVLYGASGGKQGGAAAAICDKAGHLLKTV